MSATDKSKTAVWRWQEHFIREGVESLLHDKTRPPGTAPIEAVVVNRIIELTQALPPNEATHWTLRAMAKVADVTASTVHQIWRARGLAPHRWRHC